MIEPFVGIDVVEHSARLDVLRYRHISEEGCVTNPTAGTTKHHAAREWP
jgi:hypothetical protein